MKPAPPFSQPNHPPTPPTTRQACADSVHSRRRRLRGRSGVTSAALRAATAAACLVFSLSPPIAEGRGVIRPISAGGGNGSPEACRRRGLGGYTTRGCFVLCVTPTSASAGCGDARRERQRRGGTPAMGLVGRTRAGAVSRPPLAGFLSRGPLGATTQGGLLDGADVGANGGGAGRRGAGALECRGAGENGGGNVGRARSRARRAFDRMRGRVPPPAAAAASPLLFDTQVFCVDGGLRVWRCTPWGRDGVGGGSDHISE